MDVVLAAALCRIPRAVPMGPQALQSLAKVIFGGGPRNVRNS